MPPRSFGDDRGVERVDRRRSMCKSNTAANIGLFEVNLRMKLLEEQ
jgi:hypothetical protein